MSIFAKRHYEAIAAAIRALNNDLPIQKNAVIEDLAEMFARDNPRFKNERFWRACRKESRCDN